MVFGTVTVSTGPTVERLNVSAICFVQPEIHCYAHDRHLDLHVFVAGADIWSYLPPLRPIFDPSTLLTFKDISYLNNLQYPKPLTFNEYQLHI